MLWSFDTETDTITADFEDRNLDFISNNDLLVFLPANDQHRGVLLLVYRSKAETEKYNRLSSHFCKALFKFPDFSGTMPPARHEEVRCHHHRLHSVDVLAHDGPGNQCVCTAPGSGAHSRPVRGVISQGAHEARQESKFSWAVCGIFGWFRRLGRSSKPHAFQPRVGYQGCDLVRGTGQVGCG